MSVEEVSKRDQREREVEEVRKSVDNFFYYLEQGKRQMKDLLLKMRYMKKRKEKKKECREEERKKVFVCGMGGSGIAGRLLKEVFLARAKNIDVEVISSYSLPSYASKEDYYIFISYSGNTEETLSCFDSALRIANKDKIITITRGGELRRRAEAQEVRVININKNMTPRASLPFLFSFSLYALVIFLLLDEKEADKIIEETMRLRDIKEEMKERGEEIARKIGNHIIISYGWGKYRGAMYRSKTQFNENAKHPAFYEELSESNHNFIQVFDTPRRRMLEQMVHLFVVENKKSMRKLEEERIRARISFLQQTIKKRGGESIEISIPAGLSDIASIFYVIYVLDCASVELGKMKGVNVEEVSIIESLKKYLKNLSETK